MSRIAIFFLLVIAPLLAMLLALLGVETVFTNPLGGFLLLVGLAYLVGIVIVYWIRKERFWESSMNGATHTPGARGPFFLAHHSRHAGCVLPVAC